MQPLLEKLEDVLKKHGFSKLNMTVSIIASRNIDNLIHSFSDSMDIMGNLIENCSNEIEE